MEIGAIGEFLHEAGLSNTLDRRLKPPRCVLSTRNGVNLTVCICDGMICVEDLTRTNSCTKPLAEIDLADPNSFDILLESIYANSGGREVLGERSIRQGDSASPC